MVEKGLTFIYATRQYKAAIILGSKLAMNYGRFVVDDDNFVQGCKEQICEFHMRWMRYVFCYAFCTLKCGFKDVSETLV